MSSAISVFVKNMAGDMTLLEVPTGTKVEDMPSRLTELDSEAYPPYRTHVFRSTEEEEKDTILREEDILAVLIIDLPEPETGVFPHHGRSYCGNACTRGKPYTRFVFQFGDITIYLYGMIWEGCCDSKQTQFAISLSPELNNPSVFASHGMVLYQTVLDVIDIAPSQMKNIYDVVNPYYEKLGGYVHSYNPREPVECDCGSVVLRSSMPAHKKTKKHIALIKSN